MLAASASDLPCPRLPLGPVHLAALDERKVPDKAEGGGKAGRAQPSFSEREVGRSCVLGIQESGAAGGGGGGVWVIMLICKCTPVICLRLVLVALK